MGDLSLAARRVLGLFVLLGGGLALVFIAFVVAAGGRALLTATGSFALIFLFSLALLMTCSGITLAFRHVDATQRSLVPRWALIVSGSALLLSVGGLAYFGGVRSASGIVLLGGLGAYWLWSGVKGAG